MLVARSSLSLCFSLFRARSRSRKIAKQKKSKFMSLNMFRSIVHGAPKPTSRRRHRWRRTCVLECLTAHYCRLHSVYILCTCRPAFHSSMYFSLCRTKNNINSKKKNKNKIYIRILCIPFIRAVCARSKYNLYILLLSILHGCCFYLLLHNKQFRAPVATVSNLYLCIFIRWMCGRYECWAHVKRENRRNRFCCCCSASSCRFICCFCCYCCCCYHSGFSMHLVCSYYMHYERRRRRRKQ